MKILRATGVSTSTILYILNIADDGCAERMRLICSFRRKEMKCDKASFLKRVAPRPNNALKAAAYSGQSETCRSKDLKL